MNTLDPERERRVRNASVVVLILTAACVLGMIWVAYETQCQGLPLPCNPAWSAYTKPVQ
jgi:hypothetical protein